MPPPREPRFERRLVPQAGARGEKHEVYTLAVCVRSGRERDPSASLQGENALLKAASKAIDRVWHGAEQGRLLIPYRRKASRLARQRAAADDLRGSWLRGLASLQRGKLSRGQAWFLLYTLSGVG